MISFKDIRTRIKDKAPSFNLVGGASAAGQSKAPTTLPAVFVIPAADSASPNELIGAVSQKIDESFICIIYAKNARQNKESDVSDEMQLLKLELRTAIVGWQPEGAETEIEIISGETEGFDDSIYTWSDLYTTNSRLRIN